MFLTVFLPVFLAFFLAVFLAVFLPVFFSCQGRSFSLSDEAPCLRACDSPWVATMHSSGWLSETASQGPFCMAHILTSGITVQFSFGEDQFNDQFTAGPFRLEMKEIGVYTDKRSKASWVDESGDAVAGAPIEIADETIIQDSLKWAAPCCRKRVNHVPIYVVKHA